MVWLTKFTCFNFVTFVYVKTDESKDEKIIHLTEARITVLSYCVTETELCSNLIEPRNISYQSKLVQIYRPSCNRNQNPELHPAVLTNGMFFFRHNLRQLITTNCKKPTKKQQHPSPYWPILHSSKRSVNRSIENALPAFFPNNQPCQGLKKKKVNGIPDDRYPRWNYEEMHRDSKISFNTTGHTDIGLKWLLVSLTFHTLLTICLKKSI